MTIKDGDVVDASDILGIQAQAVAAQAQAAAALAVAQAAGLNGIPALPAAGTLTGLELTALVQNGVVSQANLDAIMTLVNNTFAAQLAALISSAGNALQPYVGCVATRCIVPTDIFTTSPAYNQMSRTYHWARDDITSLQVGMANWAATGNVGEVLPTSPTTLTASIEYPVGTFTQLLWAGAPSVIVQPGTTIFTDPLAVSIPFGAKFYVRTFKLSASYANINPNNDFATLIDVANGDALSFTTTDQTMSGTVVDAGANSLDCPCAIIATTTRPSIGLIGDSRVHGYRDTVNANIGDMGQFARPVGKFYGYINTAIGNDTAANFTTGTNSSRRRSLLQYCSHICCDFGIVDIFDNTSTAAQVEALLGIVYGMPGIAGKPIYQSTLAPVSTSTDGWVTTTNQTTTNNPQRIAVNAWIRTVPSPLKGIFDVCPAVETALNSGIWKAPGYTIDGVHCQALGYNSIIEYGGVDASVFG